LEQQLSFHALTRHLKAVQYLLVGLVLGMMMYVSLSYSRSAEDPLIMSIWSAVFTFGILGGYALVIVGAIELLGANQSISDMTFPMYSVQSRTNISLLKDPISHKIREGGWQLKLIYQREKLLTIEMMQSLAITIIVLHVVFCISTSLYRYSLTVEYDLPKEFTWFQKHKYTRILRVQEISAEQLLEISATVLNSFGIPYGHGLKIAEYMQSVMQERHRSEYQSVPARMRQEI
jgi:hypothetical protein